MGAALSVSNSEAINNIRAQTVQTAENTCSAVCQNVISGVSIVLVGSTVGNITFDQKCQADASCMMKNALEQTVETYQLAEASATANLPILPIGFQAAFANARTTNDVDVSLKQVLENHCNADTDNTIQDVLIFATNSKTGDIAFTQDGNANARCVMENAGRIQLSVKQIGKATATAGNALGAIIALIIIIIVIIMIVKSVQKKQAGQPCGQGDTAGTTGPDGKCNPSNAPPAGKMGNQTPIGQQQTSFRPSSTATRSRSSTTGGNFTRGK